MTRTIQGFILAGSLVIAGAALAQGSTQGQGQAKGGMVENRGFMVPSDEKAFLERVHYINQQEIKLAQLAQQNSNNPDVKSFASDMQRDHTSMDQQLMSYAQGKGMKLSDEPKPANDMEKRSMAADKAVMDKLQVLKAEPFDSSYMANQVGSHDAALGKLMAGQKAFTQGQVATLLTQATQSVAKHRQHAYSILGKLGQSMMMGVGGAGSSSGSMGGSMGGSSGSMGGSMGGGSTGSSGSGSQTH
jgi:putative membrane protein